MALRSPTTVLLNFRNLLDALLERIVDSKLEQIKSFLDLEYEVIRSKVDNSLQKLLLPRLNERFKYNLISRCEEMIYCFSLCSHFSL